MSSKEKKLPMTMLITRKSIRLFPNGMSVGIYYSKELDKYLAISASDTEINVSEATEYNEHN